MSRREQDKVDETSLEYDRSLSHNSNSNILTKIHLKKTDPSKISEKKFIQMRVGYQTDHRAINLVNIPICYLYYTCNYSDKLYTYYKIKLLKNFFFTYKEHYFTTT